MEKNLGKEAMFQKPCIFYMGFTGFCPGAETNGPRSGPRSNPPGTRGDGAQPGAV